MNKIEEIKANLRDDPTTVCPIIVSADGIVLDGNCRVQAARELGISIPGVVLPVRVEQLDPHDLRLSWPVAEGHHNGPSRF